MADTVVDASALAAVAFGESEGPAITQRLRGLRLQAPALLWYELANVCLTKIRRQPEDADRFRRGLGKARDMTIQLHEVDPLDALAVAEETSLSAYDASYLWLARHLDADLITLDERLAAVHERRSR